MYMSIDEVTYIKQKDKTQVKSDTNFPKQNQNTIDLKFLLKFKMFACF